MCFVNLTGRTLVEPLTSLLEIKVHINRQVTTCLETKQLQLMSSEAVNCLTLSNKPPTIH